MSDKDDYTGRHSADAQFDAMLRRSLAIDDKAPPFDTVFAAAENQLKTRRRRFVAYAGAATVAAVAVSVLLLFSSNEPIPNGDFIQVADLMSSTGWSAPSDVLLPSHEFDIYQELPVFLESTKPVEGALL